MARKNRDEIQMAKLLDEIASDSLRKKESVNAYVVRLRALRELIDAHIDAALA